MKTLRLIAILIIQMVILSSFAQTGANGFELKEESLVWQHTYETDLSIEEQVKAVKSMGLFNTGVIESDLSISGQSIEIPHNTAGFTRRLIPIYIRDQKSFGTVLFQFKEGRYRVTFTNIQTIQQYTYAMLTERGQTTHLARYATKKRGYVLREQFKTLDSKILDQAYTDMFDISTSRSNNDF